MRPSSNILSPFWWELSLCPAWPFCLEQLDLEFATKVRRHPKRSWTKEEEHLQYSRWQRWRPRQGSQLKPRHQEDVLPQEISPWLIPHQQMAWTPGTMMNAMSFPTLTSLLWHKEIKLDFSRWFVPPTTLSSLFANVFLCLQSIHVYIPFTFQSSYFSFIFISNSNSNTPATSPNSPLFQYPS